VDDSDPKRLLRSTHDALARGELALATRGVERLLGSSPDWAPAVHLAGLVARSCGDPSRAEDLMRRSLLLPGVAGMQRAEYANNLGNLLRGEGYPAAAELAYREAVAAFDLPQARMGLAQVFLQTDRADEAVAVLARIPPAAATSGVYLLLSEALSACGNPTSALEVLQQAGQSALREPALRLSRASRLRELGRDGEALDVLQPMLTGPEAAAAHLATAEIQMARQQWPAALATLEQGLVARPGHTGLLSRHAALAWMLGAGSAFADGLRRALSERPSDRDLRLALATSLGNAGQDDEAEKVLVEGLAALGSEPCLQALLALRHAETGRLASAQTALQAALSAAPELSLVREQAAVIALLAQDIPQALQHTQWLVRNRPLGQFAWALRVLALRLANDPAWKPLATPETVCRVSRLDTPPGFASLDAFNEELARRLRRRHSLQAHPLVNSVRGGTQVQIHLAAEQDPVIKAFLQAIRKPVADYIRAMPDDGEHLLWRRKRQDFRLSGCWSVRLAGGSGRHVSHIHPEGWISSAYYVSVPPEVSHSADRAGWLSFGRPPWPIAGVDALGWVRPEAGQLALFPSCQWHGVEAFPGEGERLTLAFDVMPA
jgi:tetratricopeptide (TPR) repeat protein